MEIYLYMVYFQNIPMDSFCSSRFKEIEKISCLEVKIRQISEIIFGSKYHEKWIKKWLKLYLWSLHSEYFNVIFLYYSFKGVFGVKHF